MSHDHTEYNQLSYRLFAKLLMFLTLLLGGFIGYFYGYEMGKQDTMTTVAQVRAIDQTASTTTLK